MWLADCDQVDILPATASRRGAAAEGLRQPEGRQDTSLLPLRIQGALMPLGHWLSLDLAEVTCAKGLESCVVQDPMGVPGGHRRSIEVRCLVILAPEAVAKL